MAGKRRLVAVLLAGAACLTGVGGLAHAQTDQPFLVADATKRGHIDFYLVGQQHTPAIVSELDGRGGSKRLGSVVLDANGRGVIRDGARWRCDRLSRRFVVRGQRAGLPVKAGYSVRTPPCRDRLKVGQPRRVRPGGTARMVIRDLFGIGDLRLRLCKIEAGDRQRCRNLRMARDQVRIQTRFRLHREGRARIVITGRGIRFSRPIAVGRASLGGSGDGGKARILAAGDSLMQGVDGFLADRLGSRGRVFRDVNPNSGISKPGLDWARHARDFTRRVRPDASVVFLGANEGFAIRSASGRLVSCCGPSWYGEFASRVRSMMITYSRGGKAEVLWLSIPAPRSPERQALQRIVNSAVIEAARGLPRVRLVRLDQVFTPGGVYRDVMTYRGRRVRVRESDGVSAEQAINEINPDVDVVKYQTRLDASNIMEIIEGYDVIVDGVDNFPTRYLLNDATVRLKIPVVSASILGFDGQLSVFAPYEGPCYRCLYPTPPPAELAPSCGANGVLGALPGVMGVLQAIEVVKLVTGSGEPLIGRLLLYEALGTSFTDLKVRRDPECPICSRDPDSISSGEMGVFPDYEDFCAG